MIALAFALIELSAGYAGSILPQAQDQFLRVDMMVDAAAKILKSEHAARSIVTDIAAGDAFYENQDTVPKPADKEKLDKLRFSVIRLQSTVQDSNPLTPWASAAPEQSFVGSGFVVRNDAKHGPLIITNNHVVTSATSVTIQVPAAGQESYEARVVLLNPDMDIAMVELASKEEVMRMQKDVGFALPAIKLHTGKSSLGQEVITMGFPLGQNSVKLTKGVLSGHEKVGDFMAFQQTGSISPGNSGGPLFMAGTDEVLGINFAAAVGDSSQHNNYAIPSWHVLQMLHEFDASGHGEHPHAEYNQQTCRASHSGCIYKVPRLKAMAAEGNEVLYNRYGCEKGIFMSRIEKGSIAMTADPPIEPKSFVVAINGMELDKFGMVKSEKYFDDPILFTDLLFMSPSFEPVDMTVCTCGQTKTHKVMVSALARPKDPEDPIPAFDEPSLAKSDYEEFGGVTVQPLNLNIIKALAQGPAHRMDLLRFAFQSQKNKKSALVITEVSRLATGTATVQVGDILDNVNGHKVSTLAEFRQHFEPQDPPAKGSGLFGIFAETCNTETKMWTIETTTGKELAEDWQEALKHQRKSIENGEKPGTAAVLKALKTSHKKAPSMVETKEKPRTPLVARPIEERTDVRRGGAPFFDVAAMLARQ
jgi:S1-C subfamily serine protease